MGESLVEAPPIRNKMGESDPKLGVSVSFGRFGNDTLCWEKWSYFSQNKYLEEAGNLSTPGSVAKKKAYFEAHYKKKAAQKAMQLEQEKPDEPIIIEGVLENSSGIDDKSVTCNGEKSEEEIGREICSTLSTSLMIDDEAKDNDSGSITGEKQRAYADYLMDKTDFGEGNKDTVLEINKEEANLPLIMETTPEIKIIPLAKTFTDERSNLNARDIVPKATTTKRTMDKIASPIIRTQKSSNSRYSRPISVDLTKSAPQITKKKANFRAEESKSMIMGRREDKDIVVKRGFKTFQNGSNGSLCYEKCSSLKQASADTFVPKISAFPTPRNENKGSRRSPPPDREDDIGVSPSIRLRSDERAEKRKEFLKNLKAKSITREVENAQLRAKSKEEKESEIKKLRQSLNFKATPLPSFYRARGKGHSQKDGADSNIHRQQPCVE